MRVKKNLINYKDPNTGEYIPIPAVVGGEGDITSEIIAEALGYTPASEEYVSHLSEEIVNQQETLENICRIEEVEVSNSINLANPNKFTVGFLSSKTGAIDETLTRYITTEYIPVEHGKSYAMSVYNVYGYIANTRNIYLLYDINKQPISDTYVNVDSTNGLVVEITNETAKYIRCSGHKGDNNFYMVAESDRVPEVYEEYIGATIEKKYINLMEVSELSNVKEDLTTIKKTIKITNLPQLFDRNKIQTGYINTVGRIESSNERYVYTEKIDVKNHIGEIIYFSVFGEIPTSHSFRFITAYKNGIAIAEKGIDSSSMDIYTYKVPDDIEEIIISYHSSSFWSNSDYFQAEFGEISPYSEYGEKAIIEYEAVKNAIESSDILYGKKWVVCGDSFTNGDSLEKFEDGTNKTYPNFIRKRTGINIINFADGGRTLAYPEISDGFTNSLTCPTVAWYYQNIPEDADYITIYLGINDGHHRNSSNSGDGEDNTGIIPLGMINDNTVHTYYGAWNVVLTWLIENRPFAHIGIIVSNGVDTVDYKTAQLEIAKKYGIPYIDLNGDERTPAMIRSQNPNISSHVKVLIDKKQAVDYDGSVTGSVNRHPNAQAHEYESYFIENFLRTI